MENGKISAPIVEELTVGSTKLRLRNPTGANYLAAMELAGANVTMMPIYEALMCIVAINGQPSPMVRTKLAAEKLADNIGRDALESLTAWYNRKTNPELSKVLEQLGTDATIEQIQAEVLKMQKARIGGLSQIPSSEESSGS